MKHQEIPLSPNRHALLALLGMLLAAGVAVGSEIDATVKDMEGHPIEGAVVVAVPHGAKPTIKPTTVIVDQIDKEFQPYIQPIAVGTAVSFPNDDNIRHHVYSFSQTKIFELPLYAGTPANPVVFGTPGVVILGCNIHDWMLGYIYVAETPFFGKTSPEGKLQLDNLPPGEYTVRIWHPGMQDPEATTEQNVTLLGNAAQALAWQLRMKPEPRLRRAPLPGGNAYR